MSTTNPPSTFVPSVPGVRGVTRENSVKLVSHSNLFYWWPVWLLSFVMAAVTAIDNTRLAVVPPRGIVTWDETEKAYVMRFPEGATTKSLEDAARRVNSTEPSFGPRITERDWCGPVFIAGLLVIVVATNVPLRGLWSFLVLISILVVVLLISLLGGWDRIFGWFANLHIHINMAGYLVIGVVVFIMWVVATFVFDQRSYIIFTPGQIRYCEHIWDSVKVFPAAGVVLEKQRDDLFRHYVLGFFSGDLIVRAGHGADRHELKLPNVLGLGFRLQKVEDMLRRVEVQ